MKRALSIALLCSLIACKSKVTPAEGELRFTGHALDFGTVFVGHPVEKTVELTDTTNAPADGLLATGIPEVVVTPFMAHSNGGETILARVTWSPRDAGTLTGYLSLESGDSPDLMTMTGTAVLQPACPQTPCHTSAFDADAGRCVVAIAPDGTTCPEDPCLTGGSCTNGVCHGAARDCDDHDACTLDACGDEGCRHIDVAGACPMPLDPCLAPACDPDAGCIAVVLEDGTPCGKNDCATAQICVGGACVSRPAPNGSICAGPSICQDAGVCVQGACVQPAATSLVPAWVWPNGDAGLVTNGPIVLDDDDDIYFTAAMPNCAVVSLDRHGALRWQADTGLVAVCAVLSVDPAAGQLYDLAGNLALEARSLLDGSLRWSITPEQLGGAALVAPALSGKQSYGLMWVVTQSGASQLTVGVDRTTGAPVVTLPATNVQGMVGDGTGGFLSSRLDGGEYDLVTIDAAGSITSTMSLGERGFIQALSGDRLVLSDFVNGELWSLSSRMPVATLPPLSGFTVADQRTVWTLGGDSAGTYVAGFDLVDGAPRPLTRLLVVAPNAVFTTDRGTMLLFDRSIPARLSEADTRGNLAMSCPLRDSLNATLGHELLVQGSVGALVATPLPGLRPATSGWTESRGNARGDYQPK